MIKNFFQVLVALCMVTFIASCNSSDSQVVAESTEQQEQLIASPLTPVAVEGLNLNDGERWVVDEPTADNYMNLKQITDQFVESTNRDLESYHSYGAEMSNALNKLIQDCRMKGADHDALHDWLEPVIKEVNGIKKAEDPLEAQKTFASLNNQIGRAHV